MKRIAACVLWPLAGLLSALVLLAMMMLITITLLMDLADAVYEGFANDTRPKK